MEELGAKRRRLSASPHAPDAAPVVTHKQQMRQAAAAEPKAAIAAAQAGKSHLKHGQARIRVDNGANNTAASAAAAAAAAVDGQPRSPDAGGPPRQAPEAGRGCSPRSASSSGPDSVAASAAATPLQPPSRQSQAARLAAASTPASRSRTVNEASPPGAASQHHAPGLAPARIPMERLAWRKTLDGLPHLKFFELPGRPHVVFELRDYGELGPVEGPEAARRDLPFLFKAFETGQLPPSRMKKGEDGRPRQATIHEYLDWTIQALEPADHDDVDFSGFRVIVLLSRYRPQWPPPGAYDKEGSKDHPQLGAPGKPLPVLLPHGRPVSAATIRTAADYLEIPFFATSENHRGKGYGRCLLEAIEQVARACKLPRLLLCSTDDADVKATWSHLGFEFTSESQLRSWDVRVGDLLHMTNTVQMDKLVPPEQAWRSLRLKHGSFHQRCYYLCDHLPAQLKPRFG